MLAVFPILVSALEHYREGLEPLGDWWEFEPEFLRLLHVIRRQANLFDENLEQLLSHHDFQRRHELALRRPHRRCMARPRTRSEAMVAAAKDFRILQEHYR